MMHNRRLSFVILHLGEPDTSTKVPTGHLVAQSRLYGKFGRRAFHASEPALDKTNELPNSSIAVAERCVLRNLGLAGKRSAPGTETLFKPRQLPFYNSGVRIRY